MCDNTVIRIENNLKYNDQMLNTNKLTLQRSTVLHNMILFNYKL